MKSKSKKNQLKGKNVLLILGLIYTLISILAVISYVSTMNTISTTKVTISSVLGSIWWQIVMIIMFAITYILYNKEQIAGTLIEVIMGMAMLIYIVISVWTMGINLVALCIELIYPLVLIFHGLSEFKKTKKQVKTKKSAV